MATPHAPLVIASPDLDDESPIGEVIERALGSAGDLAAEEGSLFLVEVDENARAIRGAVAFVLFAGVWLSAALAWAGVALALALPVGAAGLVALSLVGAVAGVGALAAARRRLPPSILGRSRLRVERRIARVRETLR